MTAIPSYLASFEKIRGGMPSPLARAARARHRRFHRQRVPDDARRRLEVHQRRASRRPALPAGRAGAVGRRGRRGSARRRPGRRGLYPGVRQRRLLARPFAAQRPPRGRPRHRPRQRRARPPGAAGRLPGDLPAARERRLRGAQHRLSARRRLRLRAARRARRGTHPSRLRQPRARRPDGGAPAHPDRRRGGWRRDRDRAVHRSRRRSVLDQRGHRDRARPRLPHRPLQVAGRGARRVSRRRHRGAAGCRQPLPLARRFARRPSGAQRRRRRASSRAAAPARSTASI